jgi:hypothetical protein
MRSLLSHAGFSAATPLSPQLLKELSFSSLMRQAPHRVLLRRVCEAFEDQVAQGMRMSDPGQPVHMSALDAYKKRRHLVIAGHPGSGKSTVSRWLVSQLATALQRQDAEGMPIAASTQSERRLPILVTVSTYTDYQARESSPTIRGFVLWHLLERQLLAAEEVEVARRWLDDGRAVLVMDGFDEIPSLNHRERLCNAIQHFLNQSDTALGADEEGDELDGPGNRVIITSRIAGNYTARLDPRLQRFTLTGMSRDNMTLYFTRWMQAVQNHTQPIMAGTAAAAGEAHGLASVLMRLIEKDPRLLDMAQTPQLANVLATVFYKGHSLPETRVELYEAAVKTLIESWRGRVLALDKELPLTLQPEEVLFSLMEPIAEDAHKGNGVITQANLELHIQACANASVSRPRQQPQLVLFMTDLVTSQVGLLTSHAETDLKFLHRTFQEYLAGRHLLRDLNLASARMREKMGDPNWREPLLMAMSWLSLHHPEQLGSILLQVLSPHQQTVQLQLLPRSALLVAEALLEMPISPRAVDSVKAVFSSVMGQVLFSYRQYRNVEHFEALRQTVDSMLEQLCKAGFKRWLEVCLLDALKADTEGYAPTAALLISRLKWADSQELNNQLIEALPVDRREWGWPVNAALKTMLMPADVEPLKDIPKASLLSLIGQAWATTQKADEVVEILLRPSVNTSSINSTDIEHVIRYVNYLNALTRINPIQCMVPLTMRRELLSNSSLLNNVMADQGWLRVVTALFCGYNDHHTPDLIREYAEIASFLQLDNQHREPFLQHYKERWSNDDTIYNMAVYLDVRLGGRLDSVHACSAFSPLAIYRDSPWTQDLIESIPLPKEVLLRRCRNGFPNPSASAARRLDALLCLVALADDSVLELLQQATDGMRDTVLRELEVLEANLQDPLCRQHQVLSRLYLGQTAAGNPLRPSTSTVRSFLLTLMRQGVSPVVTFEHVQAAKGTDDLHVYLASEHFAGVFTGQSDDRVYNAAVCADNTSTLEPLVALRALMAMPQASQRSKPIRGFAWSIPSLMPVTVESDDIPMAVFDMLETAPRPISFIQQWALGQVLLPLFQSNPELIPEALVVVAAGVGQAMVTESGYNDESVTLFEKLLKVFYKAKYMGQPPHVTASNTRMLIASLVPVLHSDYHRARVLYRLAVRFGTAGSGAFCKADLLRQAAVSARQISSAHQRCQVLEHLLLETPQRVSALDLDLPLSPTAPLLESLIETAYRAAEKIGNPSDQALALARLSVHIRPVSRSIALRHSHEAASRIREPGTHAEICRLLQPIWTMAQLPISPRTPSGASSLYSLAGPLLAHQNRLTMAIGESSIARSASSLLTLSALIHDVRCRFDPSKDEAGLWMSLLEEPSETRMYLAQTELANKLISLNMASAVVLDQLMRHREPRVLRQVTDLLLPHLTQVELEVLPFLKRWMHHPDPLVAGFSAVALSEMLGLTPELLPKLLPLLSCSVDLLRHRAACVIHHPGIVPDKGPVRRLSVMGRELLELLAKTILKHKRLEQASVATTLIYIMHDVVFDDLDVVHQWLEECLQLSSVGPSPRLDVLIQLLENISWASSEVMAELVSVLPRCSSRRMLLAVVSCWAWMSTGSEKLVPRTLLVEQLSRLDVNVICSVRYLCGTHQPSVYFPGLLKCFRQARLNSEIAPAPPGVTSPADMFDEAGALIRDCMLNMYTSDLSALLDATMAQQCLVVLRQTMTTIPEKAKSETVATAPDDPAFLAFLIHGLRQLLHESKPYASENRYLCITDRILDLTACVVERLPHHFSVFTDVSSKVVFKNQAELDDFEALLIKAGTAADSPTRAAALLLLGSFHKPSSSVLDLMAKSCLDVALVKQVAFQVAGNLSSNRDQSFVDLAIDYLDDRSAEIVYAAIQVLRAIAHHPDCEAAIRQLVLSALMSRMGVKQSQRFVNFYFSDGKIPNPPTVDGLLLSAVQDVFNIDRATHDTRSDQTIPANSQAWKQVQQRDSAGVQLTLVPEPEPRTRDYRDREGSKAQPLSPSSVKDEVREGRHSGRCIIS